MMPGYPWSVFTYVAICLWMVTYAAISRPAETMLGIAIVLGGLPIFWLLSLGAKDYPEVSHSKRLLNPQDPFGL